MWTKTAPKFGDIVNKHLLFLYIGHIIISCDRVIMKE